MAPYSPSYRQAGVHSLHFFYTFLVQIWIPAAYPKTINIERMMTDDGYDSEGNKYIQNLRQT